MKSKNNLPIVGKSLREVSEILGTEYSFRVTTRDGVSYGVTCDARLDRVNLTLVDGLVTDYDIG